MTDGNNGGSRGRGRMWPLFVGLPLIAIIAVAAVVFAGGEGPAPRNAAQEQASSSETEASGGEDRAPQNAGQEQRSASGEEQASGGEDEGASGDTRLGHPALGEADAPVVMVEYSDYQ